MANINLVLGTMTFGESVFLPEAAEFVRTFLDAGNTELDTAYVYNEGSCERILGEVLPSMDCAYRVATKVNPRITGKLDDEAAYLQVNESLRRMRLESVDTVYLHFPDPASPVESVLSAMDELHSQGKYRELGLSNFPAWMVADVCRLCELNHWVQPTVYEGIYNPLTRGAETELNACLDFFGMRFYAYNPLAGGLLTGRYSSYDEAPTDGRFTHRPNYQKRYWKPSFFEAVNMLKDSCSVEGLSIIDATYRWLAYHSMLSGGRGDAIIIGASSIKHLKQNMMAIDAGPLPDSLVSAFASAWAMCRADSPQYFTLYKGPGSVDGVSK